MAYVVTENCIKCKYMDCVKACPVACFREGENMLVIDPLECIDCGICEPVCPADAIRSDSERGLEAWIELNARYARIWPEISVKGRQAADAKAFCDFDGIGKNRKDASQRGVRVKQSLRLKALCSSDWDGRSGKLAFFSPQPGAGDAGQAA